MMKNEMLDLALFGEDGAEAAPQTADAAPESGSAANEDRYTALRPALEKLEKWYALSPGDTQGLIDALTKEEADRAAEREARQTKTAERAKAIQDRWEQQAQAAKELFPGLELAKELQDPRFQALLCADVDVATAYQVVHLNEILPAAMSYTAKMVEGKLAGAYTAASGRPGENGAAGQSAAAPQAGRRQNGQSRIPGPLPKSRRRRTGQPGIMPPPPIHASLKRLYDDRLPGSRWRLPHQRARWFAMTMLFGSPP